MSERSGLPPMRSAAALLRAAARRPRVALRPGARAESSARPPPPLPPPPTWSVRDATMAGAGAGAEASASEAAAAAAAAARLAALPAAHGEGAEAQIAEVMHFLGGVQRAELGDELPLLTPLEAPYALGAAAAAPMRKDGVSDGGLRDQLAPGCAMRGAYISVKL